MTSQLETFLVSYIPRNEVHDCELVNRIKSFPLWVKMSDTIYAIAANLTPPEIYDRLVTLPNQDQIYVVTMTRPYHGQGSRKVDDWLHSHLSIPKRLPARPPDLIR